MNGDAVSDALLALVAGLVAWRLLACHPTAALGGALVAVAAAIGTLAFLGVGWAHGGLHHAAAVIAGCAGLPLLAVGLRWPDSAVATRLPAAVALLAASVLLAVGLVIVLRWAPWSQALPLSSALLLALAGLRSHRRLVVVGALTLVVAFVMFASGWTVPRLSIVQQLHLLTAAGLGLVGIGATTARGHRRHAHAVGGMKG